MESPTCSDASTPGSLWDALAAELMVKIAKELPPNEVSCTLRLLNKETAKALQAWKTTRLLSQPVPHHALVWFSRENAITMTRSLRRKMLHLLIQGGCSVPTLESAAAGLGLCLHGCPRTTEDAIQLAAEMGNDDVVRWLLQPGTAGDVHRELLMQRAAVGAAAGGHEALCQEVTEAVGDVGRRRGLLEETACGAARCGHMELAEQQIVRAWSLEADQGAAARADGEQFRVPVRFVAAAVYGCDLPALLQLWPLCAAVRLEPGTRSGTSWKNHIALAAALSPHPDWRAKVGWLAAQGYPLLRSSSFDSLSPELSWRPAIQAHDALERVEFLRAHRVILPLSFGRATVSHGNIPLANHLTSPEMLAIMARNPRDDMWTEAARNGDLPALRGMMNDRWLPYAKPALVAAAEGGHLHVLQWAAGPEARGPHAVQFSALLFEGVKLAAAAARSGSLELMQWLVGRGARCDCPEVFTAALQSGCVALLEWLAVQGGPAWAASYRSNHVLYILAGVEGDLAVLRCLRRLGVAWGPAPDAPRTFTSAVESGCCLPVLRWLREEGCPVDWAQVRTALGKAGGGGGSGVRRGGNEAVLQWAEEEEGLAAARKQQNDDDDAAAGVSGGSDG